MEDDAKTYRERAVQARLGAKEATRAEFRAVFERLAESYEAKARNAEWLDPNKRKETAQTLSRE